MTAIPDFDLMAEVEPRSRATLTNTQTGAITEDIVDFVEWAVGAGTRMTMTSGASYRHRPEDQTWSNATGTYTAAFEAPANDDLPPFTEELGLHVGDELALVEDVVGAGAGLSVRSLITDIDDDKYQVTLANGQTYTYDYMWNTWTDEQDRTYRLAPEVETAEATIGQPMSTAAAGAVLSAFLTPGSETKFDPVAEFGIGVGTAVHSGDDDGEGEPIDRVTAVDSSTSTITLATRGPYTYDQVSGDWVSPTGHAQAFGFV